MPTCSPDDQQSSPGPLGCHAKALLFQVGDRTLLHGIEPIGQGAPAIDRDSELVTYVIVDLFHRRPPLEVDIDMRRRILEHLAEGLIAKERLRAAYQR